MSIFSVLLSSRFRPGPRCGFALADPGEETGELNELFWIGNGESFCLISSTVPDFFS